MICSIFEKYISLCMNVFFFFFPHLSFKDNFDETMNIGGQTPSDQILAHYQSGQLGHFADIKDIQRTIPTRFGCGQFGYFADIKDIQRTILTQGRHLSPLSFMSIFERFWFECPKDV